MQKFLAVLADIEFVGDGLTGRLRRPASPLR